MLRVNTKPRKRNSPRPAHKDAPGFLQWIRGRDCFVSESGECEGKIEAAHIDRVGGKGMGTKVADRWAIPLCSKHHRMQHTIGWVSFQERYFFGAPGIAQTYWQRWPGRIAWERKLEEQQ